MFIVLLLLFGRVVPASAAPSANPDVWIWPAAYVQQAKNVGTASVFVLQRHFSRSGRIEKRGPAPWPWKVKELTIVFRFETRPQVAEVITQFFALKQAWESKSVTVRGLQLDYDSPTAKLGFYQKDLSEILEAIRKQTPEQNLSITGLTDWLTLERSEFGSDITVYFQFYRENRMHAENEMYIERLARAKFPFKIGLLPGQTLTSRQNELLALASQFRGFATFFGGTRL
ncbi:MAG: DUF3142 domain-containing protein [Deltaproteobacteria bacterium]|jgi:hypothetical protein|nr:DUF3142 domain-containing protein [Deltaproteobacteria bacterium]